MSLGTEQELFTRDLHALLGYAFTLGFEVRMGEVMRTEEQQRIYVRTGKSKTMHSNHLRKCAADLFFFKDGVWMQGEAIKPLGKFWEELSQQNSWGGNWTSFKDEPHFERRP